MYIKFCRSYGKDKKDEAGAELSPESKLSVELEGGKGKQTEGNTGLYRAVCIFLTILCLVLLLVIIVLCLKLQTGSTVCPVGEDSTAMDTTITLGPKCSYEQCQDRFPNFQSQRRSCQECPKGWLTFGQWCFYLSTFRLSWDESQRNCSTKGGSLAVISNQRTQRFLTMEGNMKYWIGLRQTGDTWTWVNNTVLRQSYWADVTPEGDCGILSSGNQPVKNWIKAPCQHYLYFICQLKL
ncbi:early activation antigen CD69 isoform X2 [Pempheris klunzingeri]|uniref:early activation antigen CD69 isoform X2 n=1 Tax=Pempheris klunzingeri TaxID=3127111 RepID=UPI00397EBFED